MPVFAWNITRWSVWAAVAWIAGPLVASAQQPAHRLYRMDSSPPGAIAQQQMARPDLRGYVQPVELRGPEGSLVSVALGEAFSPPQRDTIKAGLTLGGVYRFKIGAVPRLEEVEVFPTVELMDRLHPPPGLETRFPVPVQVTREEIEAAAAGRLVTRIIYVEDPRNAIPVRQNRADQPYIEVRGFEDPLQVADRLGRPIAILRMGSRVPDMNEMRRFAMSAPTAVLYGPADESPLGEFNPSEFDPGAPESPRLEVRRPCRSRRPLAKRRRRSPTPRPRSEGSAVALEAIPAGYPAPPPASDPAWRGAARGALRQARRRSLASRPTAASGIPRKTPRDTDGTAMTRKLHHSTLFCLLLTLSLTSTACRGVRGLGPAAKLGGVADSAASAEQSVGSGVLPQPTAAPTPADAPTRTTPIEATPVNGPSSRRTARPSGNSQAATATLRDPQAGLDPRPEVRTRTLWAAQETEEQPSADVQLASFQEPTPWAAPGADELNGETSASVNANGVGEASPLGEPVEYHLSDQDTAALDPNCDPTCDPGAPCFNGLPGVACPYPPPYFAADEYLCDGGDTLLGVVVDPDRTVRGIDPTDTVGHFDTRLGRTEVIASNRVCIYAPRFAAVRKIDGAIQNDYSLAVGNAREMLQVQSQDHNYIPTTNVQPLEPQRNVGLRAANAFRDRLPGAPLDNAEMLLAVRWGTPAYENLKLIRDGQADASQAARLEEMLQAAINWQENKAVQVTLDKQPAFESRAPRTPGETSIYEMPPGKPRLRIVKVASTQSAQPGDYVDFTLRFENVGDQEINNVTILDHLTNRLEYVEGSQKCSLEHAFLSDVQVDTLVLRWEIKPVLKVGAGGVIHFRCRVR